MRMRRWIAGLLCGLAPAAWSADGPLDAVPAVRSFMRDVESRHGMDRGWLREIFRDARRQLAGDENREHGQDREQPRHYVEHGEYHEMRDQQDPVNKRAPVCYAIRRVN